MEARRDVTNLISSFTLADIALLVIDCTEDFKAQHPTDDFLEECSVAKALGIKQLICCFNKIDLVEFSEEHYNKLKKLAVSYLNSLGFVASSIRFLPISAYTQENITSRTQQLQWFKGFTLLEELDNFASGSSKVNKAVRIVVRTTSDEQSVVGHIIGRVHSGYVMTGADLLFCPGSWDTKLVSARVDGVNIMKVTGGVIADLEVKGPLVDVNRGTMISENPYPAKEALSFTAKLMVVDTTRSLTPGVNSYRCSVDECEFSVVATTVSWPIDRITGKTIQQSVLKAGNFAIVEFGVMESVVVEKESEIHSLGCIAIRDKDTRRLLAFGRVTHVTTEAVDTLPKPIGSSKVSKKLPSPAASSGSTGTKKGKQKRR